MENPHLDALANGNKSLLAFDCEFWHVAGGQGTFHVLEGQDFFFLPREIGGFLLVQTKGKWEIKQSFFVTLDEPAGYEVAMPISHYSSVTGPTGYKLDELEQKLGLPWGEAFPSRLSPEGKKAYAEGMSFYKKDPNIKKHHKGPAWYKSFMKILKESVVVVKGTKDLEALQDAATLYGFAYETPVDVVDIALWNRESYRRCRTAKLEGTFTCIQRHIPDTLADGTRLRDVLPLGRAHDPSADASMTLLIAMYIASKAPKPPK